MQNNRVAIFGASGTGKSTAAKLLFKVYYDLRARDRYIVLSTSDNVMKSDTVTGFSLEQLGFEKMSLNKGFFEAHHIEASDVDWVALIKAYKKVVFVLESLTTDQYIDISSRICEAVHDVGNAAIWIDEAMRFYPANKSNTGIEYVVNAGAHRGVDTIALIQHAAASGKAIERSAADNGWIVAFKMSEPNQVLRFKNYFSQNDPDGKSYADRLPLLQPYHFLFRSKDGKLDEGNNEDLVKIHAMMRI